MISGDSLVPTDKGIIRAKDLNNIKPNIISTMNLGDRDIVRSNVDKFFNFAEQNTIRIGTENGYEIEGSLNHKILIRDKRGDLLYSPLHDINIGQEIVVCGSNIYSDDIQLNFVFPQRENKKNPLLNNIDNYILSIINNIDKSKKKNFKIGYDELRNVANMPKEIDPYQLVQKVRYRFHIKGIGISNPRYDNANKWYYNTYILSNNHDMRCYLDIHKDRYFNKSLDKELAELLGYMVSEGYMDHVRIIISNTDDYIIDRVIHLFKSLFDYDVKMYNDSSLTCYSKDIIGLLRHLDLEHFADKKVVPWCVLRSSKNSQINFLKALFAGDGSACEGKITYYSTSKKLCDEIHIMLLNMGIISYKRFDGYFFISNYDAEKFMRDIGFSDGRGCDIRYKHDVFNVRRYGSGDVLYFDRVLFKRKRKNKLYNMDTDRYHSFIAGGFVNGTYE